MAANAADSAARWAANLTSSREKIKAGIEAVTVAPGQAAARQKGAYVAGVQAKQDVWASRVAAVPVQDWKDAAINKGLDRIATGATQAMPKFEVFMGQLIPYINNGKGALPARGTLDQNIARATSWIRYMAQFQKR